MTTDSSLTARNETSRALQCGEPEVGAIPRAEDAPTLCGRLGPQRDRPQRPCLHGQRTSSPPPNLRSALLTAAADTPSPRASSDWLA